MDNQPLQDLPPEDEGAQGDKSRQRPGLFTRWMETLAHLGLGEMTLRIGTNVLALLLVVAVVWLMRTVYRQAEFGGASAALAAGASSPTPEVPPLPLPQEIALPLDGIPRQALLHTTIPSRPRIEVTKYTVQAGDSVFGIADKFNLNPKTLLWGNYATLKDNVHSLRPNQVLNILPVDGTYYQWQGTENLTKVAEYFGVEAEAIINYPGNHLDPDTIGDLSNPKIPIGTYLIVPGGQREFITWSAPIGVTRQNPAVARVIGEGACGAISGGAVGFGTFVWPAARHWLSGTDYHPELRHPAIDIAGSLGDAVYATDAGVVVYAGWNDWGYGNLILLDHGNGWQSYYAHLSQINVSCGQSVGQGEVIGLFGSTGNSTGPHLHFELMNTQLGKVNPHDYLPAP